MDRSDSNKFKEVITAINITYGEEFTQAKTILWWNIFKQYSIGEFETSVYKHMSDPDHGMYSPKPANIIKFITGTAKQSEQALTSAAELAWESVEGEIRAVGSYGSPRIDDGLALAAIKSLGGWVHLCGTTYDKMPWIRKEFIASYQNYAITPVEFLPKALPGRIEIENAKKNGAGEGMKAIGTAFEQYQKKHRLENKK